MHKARLAVVFLVLGPLISALGLLAETAAERIPPATAAAGQADPASAHVRSSPTRRSFRGVESWSQYVTMRDGVRLAVDVHLPRGLAAGERTATILHMSRYYRSVDIRGLWRPFLGFGIFPITERDIREDFVKAGYSWVDVDVRGAGASFGHHDYPLSAEEVRDAHDLLDWIVAQPWSAAVVGATGSSYDGTLASLLARNGHPALKVIVPRFSGWDVYGDIFAPGGLKAAALINDWGRLTTALDRGRLSDVFGWTGGVVARGVRPVDEALLPQAMAEHARNVDLVALLRNLAYRDDPDPRPSAVAQGAPSGVEGRGRPLTMDDVSPHVLDDRAAHVAIYAYAGWFDGAFPRGQIRQYLANRNPGSRLRVGPWFHGGEFNASPSANGRNNDFDHARELLRFADYHLRGIDNGFGAETPVHYYTMGEERWKSAAVWPPPGASWASFVLAPGQALVQGVRGVRLQADQRPNARTTTTPESDHDVDRYHVDPTVTTGPGSRWGLIVGTGARRGYRDRRDGARRLLTYTTRPLPADLEVTGHPVVRLFLAANATDGAVFAYLEDVRPNGEVRYVTEGQLRLVHRALSASPLPNDPVPFRTYHRADARSLVPGEVVEVLFDLLPTSFVFRAGHAIRLAIAGADAGAFEALLPVSPLIYEVHRDGEHPSRVELPTYPAALRASH